MSRPLLSRKDAKVAGLKRYFTGKPCKYGHITERSAWGICVECNRARAAARRAAYSVENREKVLSYLAAWREANPDARRAHYARNGEAARTLANKWRVANPKKRCAQEARRRARKRNQLCTCCTPEGVLAVYKACPPGHEVDHKIPIAVGGLHCVHNLQILSETDHLKKTSEDRRNIAAVKRVWRYIGQSRISRIAA